MPTVTALADRVCATTGLSTTGADRTKVLSYLNQAYSISALEAGNYTSSFSVSLTAGTADYTFGTAPITATGVLEIRQAWTADSSGNTVVLTQIPEFEMQRLRQGASSASQPMYYAVRGSRQLLLYPTPVSGNTLSVVYVSEPPTLVESGPGAGEESTPTALPSPFHYDVISNKAIAIAMEYENRFEEAAAFDQKWDTAMGRVLTWLSRFGGPTLGTVDTTGIEGPRDQE